MKKSTTSIFILFLGLLCFAGELDGTETTLNYGEIIGKIYDKETELPLELAHVVAEIGGQQYGTTSDENGNFSIKLLPPGIYEVKASYVGYNILIRSDVEVSVDRLTEVNLEMTLKFGKTIVIRDPVDPIIEMDKPQVEIFTRKELDKSAFRTVDENVSQTAGFFPNRSQSAIFG